MKASELNKAIDLALKSLSSYRDDIGVLALNALIHACPKQHGDESHGDSRPINKLISGLIENNSPLWASAVLLFAKDYFPCLKVKTALSNWELGLDPGHKKMKELVKDYGKLNPANYARVLTDEQQKARAESREKAKTTREANKSALEQKALQGEQHKARADALALENGRLKETIETNPDSARAVTLASRVMELESILREKQKTIIALQSTRDELARKVNGMESLITVERTTVHELRGAIQALENRLSKVV